MCRLSITQERRSRLIVHLNRGWTAEDIAEQEDVTLAVIRMDIARLGPLDYVQGVFAFYKEIPVVPFVMKVLPPEPKVSAPNVVQMEIPFPEQLPIQLAEAA